MIKLYNYTFVDYKKKKIQMIIRIISHNLIVKLIKIQHLQKKSS